MKKEGNKIKVKEKIKKIINPTTLIIFMFGILFVVLNKGLKTLDDEVYKNAFNSIPTFFNWIREFYTSWGGRFTPMILTNIFTNLPLIVFRIANSITLIVTVLASYKIIVMLSEKWNNGLKNICLIILFCSIAFISIPVINSGCIWICRSNSLFVAFSRDASSPYSIYR